MNSNPGDWMCVVQYYLCWDKRLCNSAVRSRIVLRSVRRRIDETMASMRSLRIILVMTSRHYLNIPHGQHASSTTDFEISNCLLLNVHLLELMLELLTESMLGRTDMLELLLLLRLCSFGSEGWRPDWRAKRFRTSVKEMTPVSFPEILAPGRADAETEGKAGKSDGDAGPCGKARTAGTAAGVAGCEGEGDALSTTHILWLVVATSLATVWASVEYGFTWNTGKESFPFSTPRSERITEMKWMHDDLRSGRLLVTVRCLVSTVEMLPMTFCALSMTAKLVRPSWCINCRASVSGLSPLSFC